MVATLANELAPVKYGILPITASVEVPKPPKDKVPEVVMVPPVMGQVVAIEVTVPLPPLGVVVAIICPVAFTARNEPAGVPRLGMLAVPKYPRVEEA